MRLSRFGFLTDENVDKEVVAGLRADGYDVLDIKEAGLFRLSDELILKMAADEQRVVISQDSDFGTLIFKDKIPVFGLIFLQPGHMEPEIHLQTLKTLLQNDYEVDPPFIIVAEHLQQNIKIRIRSI